MPVVPSASATPNSQRPSFVYDKVPNRYAVIIDAGSSGSRVQVFSWKDPAVLHSQLSAAASSSITNNKITHSNYNYNHDNRTVSESLPEIIQDTKFHKKITPGISSYSGKLKELWKSHLEPLVKHAKLGVPKSERENTPIFLLATAGMRLLPEIEQQDILLETCRLFKEKSNFYIPECGSHVSIIDGETEALYGWLSLNYLLQTINSSKTSQLALGKDSSTKSDPILPSKASSFRKSYGFMEMGGASMQIAFSPNSTETEKHINDLYTVRLRSLNGMNQEHTVFVSSWLGFGANEARKRYAQHLLEVEGHYDSTTGSNVYRKLPQDPCFPEGLAHEMKIDANKTMMFKGSGDFMSCLDSMQPLLRKDQPCNEEPCLFNGIHAPAINFNSDKFVGVSEYWYTANSIFKLNGHYDFKTFSEHVSAYCEMPWNELRRQTGRSGTFKGIPENKLKTACFKATWIINVLHSGFKFPIDGTGRLLETGQTHTPHYFKTNKKLILNKEPKINTYRNLNNHTDNIKRSGSESFTSPFQSATQIEGTELTWMLGRALLYASSQIPPVTNSTSDVGFLPADTERKHYVLGGELDGSIPKIASHELGPLRYQDQSILVRSLFLENFTFLIFFVLVGYTLLSLFHSLKKKRCMPWFFLKLRTTSMGMTLSRFTFSVHRAIFGESKTNRQYEGRFHNCDSEPYHRIIEEDRSIKSSRSMVSLSGSSMITTINPTRSESTLSISELSV